MTNIRQKGQQGERDVQKFFNDWVDELRKQYGAEPFPQVDKPFQRNQNQSAVGGDDLSNPFKLCIEVKRQEALSVNSWWNQCVESALRTKGGIPILIYKQNRKSWKVRMLVYLDCRPKLYRAGKSEMITEVAEIDVEALGRWFRKYISHNYSEWIME